MKLLLVVILVAVEVFAASGPVWTTPSKVKVTTFAVKNYSHYRILHNLTPLNLKNLQQSQIHAQEFVNQLFAALDRNYPEMQKYKDTYASSVDAQATTEKFRESVLYHSEFVFFAGHGDQQELMFYDYSLKLRSKCCCDQGDQACFKENALNDTDVCPSSGYVCPNDEYGKVFGGETRWVILDACLTLNVNKSDRINLPLTMENVDLNRVDQLRSVFKGVHAILGNYADGHQGVRYFSSNNAYSERLYEYFAKNFIDQKEPIWNSFYKASAHIVEDFHGEFGLKPAIAFLRGYDKNGNFHDTSTETFDHTFNKPIQVEGSIELFVLYAEFGTPSYHDIIL